MTDAPPALAPSRSGGSNGLYRVVLAGAALGGLVAAGLTVKYLGQSLDGSGNLDLGGLIFLAAIFLVPLTPFVGVAAAATLWRKTPLLIAGLVFELLGLASCWYYALLAFRLVKPDALESLTFLFLPVYQWAALGLCLGLGAAWQAWRARA
jgi:hypothetical protein